MFETLALFVILILFLGLLLACVKADQSEKAMQKLVQDLQDALL